MNSDKWMPQRASAHFALLFSVFTSLFIGGCATSPDTYLAATPIEVSEDKVFDYWISTKKSFSFSMPDNTPVKKELPPGHVTVRYLIDSNGKVSQQSIVESQPKGVWDKSAIRASNKQRFKPAETNPDLIPVYRTTTFYFN